MQTPSQIMVGVLKTYEFQFCDIFFNFFMSVNLLSEQVAMVKECRVKNTSGGAPSSALQ